MAHHNFMANDSDLTINPDGIFVSCSKEGERVWEFHPDDVTCVGIYSDDGRKHEVIVTMNRDFDLLEATSGLKELNGRLSAELRTPIGVDAENGPSRLGVILWPPHLAGGPLWEFYVVGKDGLWDYALPDAENAQRTLYRPVQREMARYAKPHLPEEFPPPLIGQGFVYHGEIGWCKDDAVHAAEWLRGRGAAIVDAELWIIKDSGIQPHIQTASGVAAYRHSTKTRPSEAWEAFADRTLRDVTAFISTFRWPQNATEPEQEVRFCLGWVWKEWLEENGFRFPD
jgi:hypothetical protein